MAASTTTPVWVVRHREAVTKVTRVGKNVKKFRLFVPGLFMLEAFEVLHNDLAAIHLKKSFGLEASEIPRNELPHGAQLRGQLLMALREFDGNSFH